MQKQSGNHSSKYALNPGQFEKDIESKQVEREVFKDLVKYLVITDPSKIDLRYKDLIEIALEIKQEFNL